MSEKKEIKKRKYEKRSNWWTYFEEVIRGEEAKCIIEGCSHSKIQHCGSTTPLKNHMKAHHKDILEEKGFYDNKNIDRVFSNFERKEIAKSTLLMMIIENRPFSMIQGKWYKSMMKKIQQNWIPTDHKTFDLYIDEIYEEIFTKVKNEIKEIKFFCQTSDGWKSIAQDNYYSINLHYVNENWEYMTINLGTSSIEEDHVTGEVLAKYYSSLYKKFNIENAEIIEVIDGGLNLKSAASILKHKSIHCNCHALQLPIRAGLLEIGLLQKKCSKIVQLFRQSLPALKKLKAAQLQNNSKELVLIDDNDTRWNSFLQMIERIYLLKNDLKIAFELIKSDKLIKSKVENLNEDEYNQVNGLIKFLSPFRMASKYFEESPNSNISISGMVPIIGNLIKHCKKIKEEIKNEDIFNMIEAVEEKMLEEWINIDIIFFATAFVNPILKSLNFLNEEMKNKIVEYIKVELNKIEIPNENSKKEEKEKEIQYYENLYGMKFERNNSQNNELINYMNELPQEPNTNIFEYWKLNSKKYLRLSVLAKRLLSIQGSSADVERDWSFVGDMITEKRNQLKVEKVSKMVFIKKNIKFSKY